MMAKSKVKAKAKDKDYVECITFPEWCWHTTLECVVKVLKRGHFPDTAMVQLPDDKIIEIPLNDLKDANGRRN